MFKPSLESLETRDLLSVYLTLTGTALTAVGTAEAAHNVLLRTDPAGGFDVVADGATTTYPTLTQFNYYGGVGNDTVTNRTTVPGNLNLGNGNVTVYTIAPRSFVTVGDGQDVVQVTGGNSSIFAGNGNDEIYGAPGDTINAGSGRDVIYNILPGASLITVAPHTTVDHLFTGPQTILTGALPQDHLAQFFAPGRAAGSGTLVQQGSTLYYTGTNQGDFFEAGSNGPPGSLYVVYRQGTGNFQTASFTGINQIAAFGGNGNDTFVNVSSVDDVMYGSGGVNFLFGGTGSLDLEKTGGTAAGGSIAVGRSPVLNDLNGSGNTSASNLLIFEGGPHALNIARTNSPNDIIFGFKPTDLLASLYPDTIIAALLPPYVPA